MELPTHAVPPASGVLELYSGDVDAGLLVFRHADAAAREPLRVVSCAVASAADYYHYNCCGETDAGWGCAYRAVQTIWSCLERRLDRMRGARIPTLRQIQEQLVVLGRQDPSDIGGQRWIEPPDGAALLKAAFSVESNPAEFASSRDALQTFVDAAWRHFRTHATVSMIDDSIYAYAIGGLCEVAAALDNDVDAPLDRTYVLLLDPHIVDAVTRTDFEERRGVGAKWVRVVDLFLRRGSTRWMHMMPIPE